MQRTNQSIIRNQPDLQGNPNWVSFSPTTTGNFNMSFMTIKTTFVSDGPDNSSSLFDDFVNVSLTNCTKNCLTKWYTINPNEYPNGYGPNSQDVLFLPF